MATDFQVTYYQGLAEQAQAVFTVDGGRYTLSQMVDANRDDAALCEWVCTASVGDRFPAFVACERVS